MINSVETPKMAAFPIHIGEIITPSIFWGYRTQRDINDADYRQLTEIEHQMTKMFQKAKTPMMSKPFIGCLVAVEEPLSKVWVRAKIVELHSEKGIILAKVFLLDYGEHLSNVQQLHVMPDWALYLWPQAMQFTLYGVLPTQMVFNEVENQFCLKISSDWMPAAVTKVKQDVLRATTVLFDKEKEWNQQMLGDILLVLPGTRRAESLTKILTHCQLAIFSPDQYETEYAKRVGSFALQLREGFHGSTATQLPKPVYPEEKSTVLLRMKIQQERMDLEEAASTQMKYAQSSVYSQTSSYPRIAFTPAGAQNLNAVPSMITTGPSIQEITYDQNMLELPAALENGNKPLPSISRMTTTGQMFPNFKRSTQELQTIDTHGDFWSNKNQDVLRDNTSTVKDCALLQKKDYGQRVQVNTTANPEERDVQFDKHVYSSPAPSFVLNTHSLPVMVQGYQIDKPLTDLASTPFHTDVIKILEKGGFVLLTNVQRYMWPAVCRGRNVVVVDGADSGKSVGYFAPLASRHLDYSLNKEFKNCNGPITLIVCASTSKAEAAEMQMKSLLASNKPSAININNRFKPEYRAKIILATGSSDDKQKAIDLINGCHILITTPPSFKRLLEFWPGVVTDFKRLRTLVLDDADILFEKYNNQVENILKMCKEEMAEREEEIDIQYVMASRKWTKLLESYVLSTLSLPVALLGTGLEVLAYANISPVIDVVTPDTKCSVALNIVKSREGASKIVVCCSTSPEADELYAFMAKTLPHVFLSSSSVEHSTLSDVRNKWQECANTGYKPVLIVSDDTFANMAVSNASVLINYSLPETKLKFNLRLACIMKSIPNKFLKTQTNGTIPEVLLMVDIDKDGKQIKALVEFMLRIEAPIPPPVLRKFGELNQEHERTRSDSPLCQSICSFGRCAEKSLCAGRHILNPLDIPSALLPREGDLKLGVVKVHNATHFSARIQEHTDHEGKVKSFDNMESVTLAMDISEHFSEENNRSRLGTIQIGIQCAVETSPDVYHRVQIDRILAKDRSGIAVAVQVKSLDEGWRRSLKAKDLLFLPKKLREIKPQVVDIYLCGLIPNDNEMEWSTEATKLVSSWINDMSKDGFYVTGKIVMALNEIIWVNPIACWQSTPSSKIPIRIYSFGQRLLQSKLANLNPDHLPQLKALCEDASIELPSAKTDNLQNKNSRRNAEIKQLQADWAFLSTSEFNLIKISHAESPSSFFVQNYKFLDLLDMLLDDVSLHQSNQPKNAWKSVPKDAGLFIIAKNPQNQTWHRAQIVDVQSDGGYNCLFVDYGCKETIKNQQVILAISHELLKRLPCQAVECSLYGIEPKDSKVWSQEALSAFNELWTVQDDNEDAALSVKVMDRTKSTVTGGWHYHVKLFSGVNNVDIGKSLVTQGLASYDKLQNYENDFANETLTKGGETPQSLIPEDQNPPKSLQTSDNNLLTFTDEEIESSTKKINNVETQQPNLESGEINDWEDFDLENVTGFLSGFKIEQEQLDYLKSVSNKKSDAEEKQRAALAKSEEIPVNGRKHDSDAAAASARMKSDDIEVAPKPKCVLISTCYDTNLTWSQTKEFIKIKIHLVGVTDYHLKITPSYADFATRCQGKAYCVNINLFGYVLPNRCTYQAQGQYMEMKLHKSLQIMWPRLDHPDRGVIGASHKIETYMNFKGDDSSDDDEGRLINQKWLNANRLGTHRIAASNEAVMHDIECEDESDEGEEECRLLTNVDIYDPLS